MSANSVWDQQCNQERESTENIAHANKSHTPSNQRRHSWLRRTEAAHRHTDCRTPGHAGRWPHRANRHAGLGSTETQDFCCRTSPDGSGTAEAVGSDQRNNRAVTRRHARTTKAQAHVECRWQSRNHCRHQSTLGSGPSRSCESEASRRRDVVGEEIGGEEGSGKEALEEGGLGSRSAGNGSVGCKSWPDPEQSRGVGGANVPRIAEPHFCQRALAAVTDVLTAGTLVANNRTPCRCCRLSSLDVRGGSVGGSSTEVGAVRRSRDTVGRGSHHCVVSRGVLSSNGLCGCVVDRERWPDARSARAR
jgi:hypothetical protein